MSVQHAMIDRQRHIAKRSDLNGIGTIHITDHSPLFELANTKNGRLGLVDDDGSGKE